MFARPNARHSQIAYVTNDITAAAALFERDYGAPGFFHFSNVANGVGAAGGPELRIALARVGGVEIELIEPVGDTAPMFAEVLPGGPDLAIRFHHVAIRIDGPESNWQGHIGSLDLAAHPIAFYGDLGDQLHFLYTDERATLGHYVEHVWMAPALLAQVAGATPTYP